ncbi:MAG TPA: DNA primase [Nevskiaceae bacterium]|nr:DNA primase [Nevskiaceae bacterium]
MRIPQSFIQDLLARTDIVEVIGSRLELKRAGREFKACSPFTNEKTPSFYVSPAKQFFHCFSSGKHGNAIGFLMEYDRLSFVEAVEELAGRAGLEVPREGGRFERAVMEGPLDALAAAQRHYAEQLRQSRPALDYLKKRGVGDETLRTFGIGYAPDAWDSLSRRLGDPVHALTAGLLKKSESGRVFDVFRNRVMFPIRDTRGRVIAFGGRTLANDPAKYLNSPETPLFHKGRQLFGLYEAKQARRSALDRLIVVEGYMDVVMLAQHGVTEAVATLGTATTREHLALLFKSTDQVVFCFDGDRAGRAAAWRALEQALPEVDERRQCRFMFLPDGHDPDTLVQEIGEAAFRARVAEAMSLGSFLIGELVKQVDLATPDGRARLVGLARPHLARLREGALRTVIVDELARLTRLRREDFASAAPPAAAAEPESGAGEPPAARSPAPNRPVRRALQLLLERPDLADLAGHLELLARSGLAGAPLLVEVLETFREHPGLTAGQLLEQYRDRPEGAILQKIAALALDVGETALEAEFRDVLQHLTAKALEARFQALMLASQSRALSPAELQESLALQRQLKGQKLV